MVLTLEQLYEGVPKEKGPYKIKFSGPYNRYLDLLYNNHVVAYIDRDRDSDTIHLFLESSRFKDVRSSGTLKGLEHLFGRPGFFVDGSTVTKADFVTTVLTKRWK